ncbi:MAG: hypothetical protein NTW80_05710, partial [Deltaproteobacteria bacterium]|nr:hypothetical protein [Deltaproteobacteria bacterium]
MASNPQAGGSTQAQEDYLLGNERRFREERRAYQPQLSSTLAAGPGLTRPLDGFELDVLKVAREQLPFVSQNRLLEITPGGQGSPKPRRLGIVLSGGPAPGGHNVIAGLFEAAK